MKRYTILFLIALFFLLSAVLVFPSTVRAGQKKKNNNKKKDDGLDGDQEPPKLSGEAKKLVERTKGIWDDGPIEKAINKGVKWLYKQQHADGSFGKPGPGHVQKHCWDIKKDSYKFKNPSLRAKIAGTLKLKREPKPGMVGKTSVAVYALLKAGEDIHNDKVQSGLKFLTTHDMLGVYSIGLRCNTWVAAEKHARGKYMRYLRHDAQRLIYSIHKDTGGWNYSFWEQTYHNSPAQYGILGVWGYQMLGGEIPSSFWPLAMKYWVKGQLSNGAWSYHPPFRGGNKKGGHHQPRGSMSAAGVASMFVIVDAMMRSKYINCEGGDLHPVIVKGLRWFDREFANTMVGKTPACGGNNFCYYLYGVERVGRACGYKYFGNQDWFKLGALTLVKRQKGDGSWGNVPETSFAILFLVKGRHPVLFNKLDFGGDWNNRPRDLSNLVRWMSRNYEREFNWQNVTLRVDPFEWHDAPILYISGAKKPSFTDEEIKKLRTFAYQGGTIYSCTECGGKGFRDGIREIYRKAFPRYELSKIEPDHPIYSVHAKLNGKPELYMISNGARPLVIHTDEDVARVWQLRAYATSKKSFQFGVNLSRYIVGTYKTLLPRGKTYWPFPARGSSTVEIVRLKYGGNYNPEPLAYVAFSRNLARDEKTSVKVTTIPIGRLGNTGAKIAVMTGTDSVTLSPSDKNAIKAFVKGGGTLVCDAAGGNKKFYISMHQHLRDMFGGSAIKPLNVNSKIFSRSKNPIKEVRYRIASRRRIESSAVQLKAVTLGGRNAVVLSREDIISGLLGFHSGVVDGYEPESAYAIMRNIVMISK